ncbi:MAG: hypothetical protein IKL97_07055 [Eggerthellaceae bacterium]|nr:hypothetical protein [Eggerthellaceae bacterium]
MHRAGVRQKVVVASDGQVTGIIASGGKVAGDWMAALLASDGKVAG